MKIDLELVDRLAHLARLQFHGDEKENIRGELEKILDFCEQLNAVKTDGLEPLIYVNEDINVLRDDIPQSPLSKEETLLNAPKKDSDFFRVPKVIEK